MPNPSLSPELSPARQLAGADANIAFASRLACDPTSDGIAVGWAVSAIFYAAVHEVRTYLCARHDVRLERPI